MMAGIACQWSGVEIDTASISGRAINPITGTNWEGVGVEPHVPVRAEDALKIAHLSAVEGLASKCQDENERNYLSWIAEIIESDYSPVVLDRTDLSRCAGEFGKRKFLVENGDLFFDHQDSPESWRLVPMTKTRFRLDEDVKFEFILGEDGRASEVKIYNRDGRPEVVANRTG